MAPRINNIQIEDNSQNNQNIFNNLNNGSINQNNRSNNNINNNNNHHHSNILYNTDINLNIIAENTNKIFIFLYNPNKITCIILLLLNILVAGLGTFIISCKNCSLYDFLLGFIQFFCCYSLLLKGIEIKETHNLFNVKINLFLSIYLIVLAILFYMSSIYVGIFHNFIFFNPRITKITENREKGICIIFLNLVTGGLGTLLYGFLSKNEDCFNRIKIWGVGIVQICGFIMFIFAFSLIGKVNRIILIILFFIGGIGYLTSICIGIKCYKKISISIL